MEKKKKTVLVLIITSCLLLLFCLTLYRLSTYLAENYKNSERFQEKKIILDAQWKTAVGKPYVDVKGFDLNDKEIALSDFVGKGDVVLVDFWASWCGPCRKKLPEIKTIYQKYKDKGLVIVGISLDDDKDKWLKTTKEEAIEWPQLSNLKKWEESARIAYGVNLIPYTILIGKDGIIADRNKLTAKKIEALLAK